MKNKENKQETGKCLYGKDLIQFNFNEITVRSIDKNGEIWFVAKDISDFLGFSDSGQAVRALDSSEKTTLQIIQGGSNYKSNQVIISESGLYSLIFRSRKPEAIAFKLWVTSEVLPSIRKTGEYKMSEEITELNNRIGFLTKKLNTIEPKVKLKQEILRIGHLCGHPTAATGGLDAIAGILECDFNINIYDMYKSLYGKRGMILDKYIDMFDLHGMYDVIYKAIALREKAEVKK